MPLKPDDLKTVENYKKASRVDLPKVASGNAKFWIYKDVELPNASGKNQKYPAFLALVDDNGIRKTMTGKKLICKGTCGIRENRIAFEPTTGTVPYKQLKTSLPLLLGKAVWIPTGMEDAGDEEEAGAAASVGTSAAAQLAAPPQPPAAPPPPQAAAAPPAQAPGAPPLTAASLTGPWTKLVKDVQAYAAAHPERKADLSRDLSAIGSLLKANQAAEAKPKMDKLQAALDAPPAATPAGPGGPAQAAARWSALVKQMQAIIAANPEKKADLVRASAGIPDMIKAGKLDLAAKLMDTVERVVGQGSAPGARPSEGTGSRQPVGTPYPGIVKYRQALLQFAQAKSEVKAQIGTLKSAILKVGPQKADFADGLAAELEKLNEEVADAVDEAMKASENQASPATDAVKLKIREYLAELASNPLVQEVEANPLGVKVTIGKTLGGALARIKEAMPA